MAKRKEVAPHPVHAHVRELMTNGKVTEALDELIRIARARLTKSMVINDPRDSALPDLNWQSKDQEALTRQLQLSLAR